MACTLIKCVISLISTTVTISHSATDYIADCHIEKAAFHKALCRFDALTQALYRALLIVALSEFFHTPRQVFFENIAWPQKFLICMFEQRLN